MEKNRQLPSGRPLILTAVLLWLTAATGMSAETAPERGTINGCVELPGHTVYRGVAALWPALSGKEPDPRRAIRPPVVSRPLGTDGCFSLQAKPGEYFVGTVVRLTDGGWQGPPRPGDMVFLSPDATGKSVVATIRPSEAIDIGRHATGWLYTGFSSAATPLTISGTLTDPSGKPLSGLLVFAFTDRTMSQDPLAVSEPSDSSGHYLLRLPEPATVYLRAREHYGRRSPEAGGYMGVYGNENATPVIVDGNADKQAYDFKVILVPPLNNRQKPATPAPSARKNN